MNFIGLSRPLSDQGMNSARDSLSVGLAELWTVLQVETRGCGFLADRRPVILFERHVFHEQTNGAYDASHPSISSPNAGGYLGGAAEYTRLSEALALDEEAALKSASWGIGQIMGYNAPSVGFPSAEVMVQAMVDGEDAQLAGVAGFLRANGLDRQLASHNWAAFAAGYNGPNYQKNAYDTRLAGAYAKLSTGPLPQIIVRQAQVLLTFLGIDCGGIDGVLGSRTQSAVVQFRSQHNLGNSAGIDQGLIDQLTNQLAASTSGAAQAG